ncbi:MAG: hypothetical protein ACXAEX_22065 [Promethearchaeota archaeon]|jgi:hypothetical protein
MKGFPLDQLPERLWMSVEDVVAQSLDAFKKESVIFIPGDVNRSNVRRLLQNKMKDAKKFLYPS